MATYSQIQEYIKDKYGYTVKTCWIAHMKEQIGLAVKISSRHYNPGIRTNPCPVSKRNAIIDAFNNFHMIP